VIRKEDLRPAFTTVVTRRVIELEPHASTRIEVAIDKGEIRTADCGAVEPISEVELELKRGDPAVLYDWRCGCSKLPKSGSRCVAKPSEAIGYSDPLPCRGRFKRCPSLSIPP
jgi:hypothetical protein